MMYNECLSVLPPDLKVGAEVGIIGDGLAVYTVTKISHTEKGVEVHLSCGWREPLSKIYLLRGRSHSAAIADPTSWIATAIGECDKCKTQFPDCCVYNKVGKKHFCNSCYNKGI